MESCWMRSRDNELSAAQVRESHSQEWSRRFRDWPQRAAKMSLDEERYNEG